MRDRFIRAIGYFCAALSALSTLFTGLMAFCFTYCLYLMSQPDEYVRWDTGVRALSVLVLESGSVALSFGFFAHCFWNGYQKEHFADGIVVPREMSVKEPVDSLKSAWGKQSDDEFSLMTTANEFNNLDNDKINNVELPAFDGPRRALLLRHLSTSCKWRVSEERGKIFAVRREVDDAGNWVSNLNGYTYGKYSHLSTRTVRGLDEPIYADVFNAQEFIAQKGTLHIPFTYPLYGSYFYDRFGSQHLEIYEQSPQKCRTFTNQQLTSIKTELEHLSASRIAAKRGFDTSLMPAFSNGPNLPELKVIQAKTGGGTYHVDAFVNPGEFGRTFLRVFKATRNSRLSEGEVSKDSLEYIGWSDDKTETFFYDSLITINEGNSHFPYPARFELWFQPDNKSKPERKLLERIYLICGCKR